MLRAGFEQSSDKCGQLMPGDIVDALESRLNPAGVVRIATGYLSLQSTAVRRR